MKALIIGGGGMAEGIKKSFSIVGKRHISWQILSKKQCDVRDISQIYAWIEKINPSIVIVTAGISEPIKLGDRGFYAYQSEITTNLIGSFNVAHVCCTFNTPTMIFIASVAGLYGKPNHAGYSASKAGVRSLVQSLGMEGRNAYAISPGRVDTPMREKDYPGDTPGSRLSTKDIGLVVKAILKGRYNPGDNLIIRKEGLKNIIREIDRGDPWLTKLKVGQPVTI
jgi:NAD(P)-dependent dehydrogenase (short-subunit alcohol dehydrogenase family)